MALHATAMQPAASTQSSIDAELAEVAGEFEMLGDWEERLQHVIDLGKTLTPLTDAERTEANKVRGCASQVWLVTGRGDDGRLIFRGDSDAIIVRGLMAVLLRLYSGRPPAEILAFDAKAGLTSLGLPNALSMQRSNGLFSMVERIRRDAAAA